MADWSGVFAVLTVKYINMKRQEKAQKEYYAAWEKGRQKAADTWNERNNCVPVEKADEIWDYVVQHKEEVEQLLIDNLDPEDKRYDSKVRLIKAGCLTSLCDDYCMFKYGKMCYPSNSKKRHEYYDYVKSMARIYALPSKNQKKGLFNF